MGFYLPAGVVNTNSAYFYVLDGATPLGPLIKEPSDQTLVIIDYSKMSVVPTISDTVFTVDVSSNPQLVISFAGVSSPINNLVHFLLSGGIQGQQYKLSIRTTSNSVNRVDVLTINIPSSGDCCEQINPVPSLLTELPLGEPTQGYVNTGVRFFWGSAPPANPNVLDQWYNIDNQTLYEWVNDGTKFFWEVIMSEGLVEEAPTDDIQWVRYNGYWIPNPIQQEAPADNQNYVRCNYGWLILPDNPIDTDAPSDGSYYVRRNAAWVVDPTGVQPSSSPPNMNNVADAGVATTYSRGDHVHPSDISRYSVSNPANYQSAVQLAAAVAPMMPRTGGTFSGGVSFTAGAIFAGPANLSVGGGTAGQVFTSTGSGGLCQWANLPAVPPSTIVSITAPPSPVAGMLWWDSTAGQLYIWYVDVDTGQWVAVTNATGGSGGGGGGIPEAPTDGQLYGRKSSAWAVVPSGGGGGITDAPSDGIAYIRKSAAWNQLDHTDVIDWSDTLAPYALTMNVPAAVPPSSTNPVMDGAVAIGTGTTYARADHVHPSDTSRVPLSGGTMTGLLTLSADPSVAAHASTKQYVDKAIPNENKIINGEMRIDQRNAGAAVNNTTAALFSVDRWTCNGSIAGKFSVQQQSTGGPAGFPFFVRCAALTTFSLAAGDYNVFAQSFEADTVADLGFGAAGALYWSVSFWARASVAGVYSGSLCNSAENRSYAFSFTIASANVWQKFTQQTLGIDATGTWVASGNGLWGNLRFDLGSGATFRTTAGSWQAGNFVGATAAQTPVVTAGRTFDITGVKFEAGPYCTTYQRKSLAASMADCQRYYQSFVLLGSSSMGPTASYSFWNSATFPTLMRVTPTMTVAGSGYTNCSAGVVSPHSAQSFYISALGTSTGGATWVATITASAEI